MTGKRVSAPPDPATARTASGYVDSLNELRAWAGSPSLRRLRQLGGSVISPSGDEVDALPPSTTSHLLNGRGLPRLPRLEFVRAYVGSCFIACGHDAQLAGDELTKWVEAWRALAAPADIAATEATGPPGKTDVPPVPGERTSSGSRNTPLMTRALIGVALLAVGGLAGYLLADQTGDSGNAAQPGTGGENTRKVHERKVTSFSEGQGIDLDANQIFNERRKRGIDVTSWDKGGTLSTDSPVVRFAWLRDSGAESPERCMRSQDDEWKDKVPDLRGSATKGRQLCVVTSRNLLAMITFDKPPAPAGTLDFHYAVWNIPAVLPAP